MGVLSVRGYRMFCSHEMYDDLTNGVSVCSHCGTVKQIFSSLPEWRDGAMERCEMGTRCGAEFSGTEICGTGLLSKVNRSLLRYNRTVYEDKLQIENICVSLKLSGSIRDAAVQLMEDTRRHCAGVWRGNRRVGLRAACVSIECQRANVGVNDTEIISLPFVQLQVKCINRQKKMILTAQHDRNRSHVSFMTAVNHGDFGLRFCAKLGFDYRLSSFICTRAQTLAHKERLQSKPSNFLLAVAVMRILSTTKSIRCSQLCDVTGVTAPTLAKWYADAYQVPYADARRLVRTMRQ